MRNVSIIVLSSKTIAQVGENRTRDSKGPACSISFATGT